MFDGARVCVAAPVEVCVSVAVADAPGVTLVSVAVIVAVPAAVLDVIVARYVPGVAPSLTGPIAWPPELEIATESPETGLPAEPRFSRAESLRAALPPMAIIEEIPLPAAFLAGHAHADYRRAGGTRAAVLPDFLIGAHAAVSRRPLLTRDPRRIATYIPGARLITPPEH
jgi:hypothetical protein